MVVSHIECPPLFQKQFVPDTALPCFWLHCKEKLVSKFIDFRCVYVTRHQSIEPWPLQPLSWTLVSRHYQNVSAEGLKYCSISLIVFLIEISSIFLEMNNLNFQKLSLVINTMTDDLKVFKHRLLFFLFFVSKKVQISNAFISRTNMS